MFREALVSGFLALTLACTPVLAQTEPVPPPTGTEQGPLTEPPARRLLARRRLLTPPWPLRRQGIRRRRDRRRGAQPIERSSGAAEATLVRKGLRGRLAGKLSFPALARSDLAWRLGWSVARKVSEWGYVHIPTNCTLTLGNAAQTQTADAEIPTAIRMAVCSEGPRCQQWLNDMLTGTGLPYTA